MTVHEAQAALEAAARDILAQLYKKHELIYAEDLMELDNAVMALAAARAAEAEKCPMCGGTRFTVQTDANGYRNSGYCRACGGTGKAKSPNPKCPTCGGKGVFRDGLPPSTSLSWKTCPTCKGKGWYLSFDADHEPCAFCNGTGKAKLPLDDPPMILCSGEPDCDCSGCKLGTGKTSEGRETT